MEQRERLVELRVVEHPLGLADHDRVESTPRILQETQQPGGLRPSTGRYRTRLVHIEELGDDPSTRADQRLATLALP
nr:hypothetical protein [Nocardiopsis mwathae]